MSVAAINQPGECCPWRLNGEATCLHLYIEGSLYGDMKIYVTKRFVSSGFTSITTRVQLECLVMAVDIILTASIIFFFELGLVVRASFHCGCQGLHGPRRTRGTWTNGFPP